MLATIHSALRTFQRQSHDSPALLSLFIVTDIVVVVTIWALWPTAMPLAQPAASAIDVAAYDGLRQQLSTEWSAYYAALQLEQQLAQPNRASATSTLDAPVIDMRVYDALQEQMRAEQEQMLAEQGVLGPTGVLGHR